MEAMDEVVDPHGLMTLSLANSTDEFIKVSSISLGKIVVQEVQPIELPPHASTMTPWSYGRHSTAPITSEASPATMPPGRGSSSA